MKSGNGGKREFCGNDKGDVLFFATGEFFLYIITYSRIIIIAGSFKATLRTSKIATFLGFSASVICFNMDPPSSEKTSVNRRPGSNSGMISVPLTLTSLIAFL